MILDDCSYLTYGSGKKVNVQCENCGLKRLCEYKSALRRFKLTGKNLCKKCPSDETRKKIAFSKIGKVTSDETRKKISLNRSNKCLKEKNGMYGRLHTEEAIKKMSLAKIGKYKGKNNPNWKVPEERVTTLCEQIRNSEKYKFWRKICFERDDYTCQICQIRGGDLQVDHIRPFALLLKENNIKTKEGSFNCKLLWNLNNGRTLCVDCHKKTDTFLNGTKKILQELKKDLNV